MSIEKSTLPGELTCFQTVEKSKYTDFALVVSAIALGLLAGLASAGLLNGMGPMNAAYFSYGMYAVAGLLLILEGIKLYRNCCRESVLDRSNSQRQTSNKQDGIQVQDSSKSAQKPVQRLTEAEFKKLREKLPEFLTRVKAELSEKALEMMPDERILPTQEARESWPDEYSRSHMRTENIRLIINYIGYGIECIFQNKNFIDHPHDYCATLIQSRYFVYTVHYGQFPYDATPLIQQFFSENLENLLPRQINPAIFDL